MKSSSSSPPLLTSGNQNVRLINFATYEEEIERLHRHAAATLHSPSLGSGDSAPLSPPVVPLSPAIVLPAASRATTISDASHVVITTTDANDSAERTRQRSHASPFANDERHAEKRPHRDHHYPEVSPTPLNTPADATHATLGEHIRELSMESFREKMEVLKSSKRYRPSNETAPTTTIADTTAVRISVATQPPQPSPLYSETLVGATSHSPPPPSAVTSFPATPLPTALVDDAAAAVTTLPVERRSPSSSPPRSLHGVLTTATTQQIVVERSSASPPRASIVEPIAPVAASTTITTSTSTTFNTQRQPSIAELRPASTQITTFPIYRTHSPSPSSSSPSPPHQIESTEINRPPPAPVPSETSPTSSDDDKQQAASPPPLASLSPQRELPAAEIERAVEERRYLERVRRELEYEEQIELEVRRRRLAPPHDDETSIDDDGLLSIVDEEDEPPTLDEQQKATSRRRLDLDRELEEHAEQPAATTPIIIEQPPPPRPSTPPSPSPPQSQPEPTATRRLYIDETTEIFTGPLHVIARVDELRFVEYEPHIPTPIVRREVPTEDLEVCARRSSPSVRRFLGKRAAACFCAIDERRRRGDF